jgi:hypothetical protein
MRRRAGQASQASQAGQASQASQASQAGEASETKEKTPEELAEEKAKLRIQPYTVRFADWMPFRSLSTRVRRCKVADPNACEQACNENGGDCRDVTLTRPCKVLCTRDLVVPAGVVGQRGFNTHPAPFGPLGPRGRNEREGPEWDLGGDLSSAEPAAISLAIDQIVSSMGAAIGVPERGTAEAAPREALEEEYRTLRPLALAHDPPLYHACRVVDPSGELVFLLAELNLFEEPDTEDGYPGDVSVVNEVPIIPDDQRREVLRLFDEYAAKQDPAEEGGGGGEEESKSEADEWYAAGEDPEAPDFSEALSGMQATREDEKRRRMVRLAVGGGVLAALLLGLGVSAALRATARRKAKPPS